MTGGRGLKPPRRAERTELHGVAEVLDGPARFSATRSLRRILSMVFRTPRVEPIRQGVHLPQDSTAQNSIAKRACLAMSTLVVEHDDAAMGRSARRVPRRPP